jgi:hypothetical protein
MLSRNITRKNRAASGVGVLGGGDVVPTSLLVYLHLVGHRNTQSLRRLSYGRSRCLELS